MSPTPPLPYRRELFAYHIARGASLAQAVRLAGYSPQGARQRGCLLVSEPAVRQRIEVLRHAWMTERARHEAEAIAQLGQVVEMALRGDRPTTAMNALMLQLKLRGVVNDARAGLYASSPDEDLAKALFDPREDEDKPFNPPTPQASQPQPIEVAPRRDLRPSRRVLH